LTKPRARGTNSFTCLSPATSRGCLSWPWEALRDPKSGVLAQTCQIERRLNRVGDPQPISTELPNQRVNILLVTARPYQGDVHYRSISRPLVELIEKERLPASVHVLRPPTFVRLREHLRERPHFYHLIHFDGHGSVTRGALGNTPGFTLRAAQGQLIFEDEKGAPHSVTAEQLSVLLKEHSIPCMVLNACQSAMFAADAQDPFAAVSAALLQAGIRSVVAMAWRLYVSAGQQFLPAFYRRLFETGNVAQATRAGRQQMFARPIGSVRADIIRFRIGWYRWYINRIRTILRLPLRPKWRLENSICRRRSRISTIPTGSSGATRRSWSWSARCGGRPPGS
jgi:hypothetical protein